MTARNYLFVKWLQLKGYYWLGYRWSMDKRLKRMDKREEGKIYGKER